MTTKGRDGLSLKQFYRSVMVFMHMKFLFVFYHIVYDFFFSVYCDVSSLR